MAARWQRDALGGEFAPFDRLHAIDLDDLLCVDEQKRLLTANTEQFVRGFPANNALLWGARGTGKSSLVHALLNRYGSSGLRLVEVSKEALADVAEIAARLESEPYRFLLVCDDLSFEAGDASYTALKSALEGSVFTQSANVVIYATSNRRHLVPEHMADNLAARHVDGELHQAESVEEKISLSDRFGLWLSFHPFRQDDYLLATRHLARPAGGRARRGCAVERRRAPSGSALGAGARRAQRAHGAALRQAARRRRLAAPPPTRAKAPRHPASELPATLAKRGD